jgi:hypothetical protein
MNRDTIEEKLRTFFSQQRQQVKASEVLADRIIKDAVGEDRGRKPTVWRIIMKKRITPYAVASAIAILIGWVFLFLPLTSSNRAWAKMLETMKEMNWIHIDIVFNTSPDMTKEMCQSFEQEGLPWWISFNPEIQISKKLNGDIIYTDLDREARYYYLSDSNTITIDSHASQYSPSGPKSPFEIIDYYVEMIQESQVQIQSKLLVQDGREVEMISLSHQNTIVTGMRDVERNVLVKVIIESPMPPESDFIAKTQVLFTYPENGPADIYAAGAPANAQVIDRRPQGNAMEIMQTIQEHYDYNYGNRVCVLFYSRQLAGEDMGPRRMVVSRKKGKLYRADSYMAEAIPFLTSDQPMVTIYGQIKESWPHISIEEAFQLENNQSVRSQDFYDGKYVSLLQGGPPAKSLKTSLRNRANGPTYALEEDINTQAWVNPYDLGVNNSRIAETITRLPENPQYEGLLGVKVSFALEQKGPLRQSQDYQVIYELWVDPAKDYMVMHRTKWQHRYSASRIVETFLSEAHILETSQTSDGQWYPVHVERKMHYSDDLNANDEIHDIHIRIDTDWTASDAIFDRDYRMGVQ